MKKMLPLLLSVVSISSLLTGCAAMEDLSGESYSREAARQPQTVQYATIVAIKPVTIEGTDGSAGSLGGGLLGAAVGSNVGGGGGRLVGAAAGAIVGAVAGSAVEHSATTRHGIEITVQYENGAQQAIVQEQGNDNFAIGQQVKILSGAGTTRVRPL